MEQMIQIKNELIGTEKIQAVNARDLWRELESKQEFANWIKNRIKDSQAIEGQDFIVFDKNIKNPLGGRPEKEYLVSLDMAKHFCMLERNEKGREIRQYFIDVEKEARKILTSTETSEEFIARALIEAHKLLDKKNQVIEEQKIEIEDQAEKINWLECKKNIRVLETKIQEAPRRVYEHYVLSDYKEAYRLIYKEFKRFMGYDIGRLWKKKRKSNKETLTQFLIRTGRHNDYLRVIEALVSVKNQNHLEIEDQLVIWNEGI